MFRAISALVKDSSTSSSDKEENNLFNSSLFSFFILSTAALISSILEAPFSTIVSSVSESSSSFNLSALLSPFSAPLLTASDTGLVPFSAALMLATALSTGFSSGLTTSALPDSIFSSELEPCL